MAARRMAPGQCAPCRLATEPGLPASSALFENTALRALPIQVNNGCRAGRVISCYGFRWKWGLGGLCAGAHGGSDAQMNSMGHLRARMRAIRPAQRGGSFSVKWPCRASLRYGCPARKTEFPCSTARIIRAAPDRWRPQRRRKESTTITLSFPEPKRLKVIKNNAEYSGSFLK